MTPAEKAVIDAALMPLGQVRDESLSAAVTELTLERSPHLRETIVPVIADSIRVQLRAARIVKGLPYDLYKRLCEEAQTQVNAEVENSGDV